MSENEINEPTISTCTVRSNARPMNVSLPSIICLTVGTVDYSRFLISNVHRVRDGTDVGWAGERL